MTEFIDAQYDTVARAAEGCDVLPATAMSHFVAQSAAEKAAVPHRYVTFGPSVLDHSDAQNWNALLGPPINAHRASIDLPEVDDVRKFMFTDHLWVRRTRPCARGRSRRISPSCGPRRGSCPTSARSRPSR
ncbi:MAG: hypothetical protein ACXVFL_08380 [Solirubrobacteraceae bacterium]